MKLQAEKPVGEIAVEAPRSIPYFEERGIDYCCGGKQSLQEACAKAGIPVEEAVQSLESLTGESAGSTGPWIDLSTLILYILEKHHAYTREQLDLAEKLGAKVLSVHGQRRPELAEVNRLLGEMAQELRHHLIKEENVAFPFLRALDGKEGGLPFPYAAFQNGPQQVLASDHKATGEQLSALRGLTGSYTPPPDACVTFRAFYRALAELESDLHRHIHLENNVLFPMAEKKAAIRK